MIGAGLMGGGIALEAARAGLRVIVIDRSAEEASKAHDYVQRFFDRRIKRGRATQEQCDAVKAKIETHSDYAHLKPAQIVIEAVFEDRAIKAQVSRGRRKHLEPGGHRVEHLNPSDYWSRSGGRQSKAIHWSALLLAG